MIVTLFLNHHVVQNFSKSPDTNERWKELASYYTELEEVTQDVNQPSNDIFKSHSPNLRRERMANKTRHLINLMV